MLKTAGRWSLLVAESTTDHYKALITLVQKVKSNTYRVRPRTNVTCPLFIHEKFWSMVHSHSRLPHRSVFLPQDK